MITTQKKFPAHHNTPETSRRRMQVTEQGPLSRAKWAFVRLALSTFGRLSKGISVGYRYGFDSGMMLDYVYCNQPQGLIGLGKLIDQAYLNAIGWRAIRARRVLLKACLCAEVEHRRTAASTTRLLDVAAGPGRYLQEFLQECASERDDLRVLCRDLSPEGLAEGRRQAQAAGLQSIFYEQGDAFNPAPTTLLEGAPDIIVVSGLYELILDDKVLQQSLARYYQMLAPGGAIFFTTQTHHPQLDFIANVLPNRHGLLWVMKCRQSRQLEARAREAGFQEIQSQAEEVGLFTVTIGRKLPIENAAAS